MGSIRQKQVASTIQRSFSTILQREGVYIYGDALVTVTRVNMTPDMGIARIYLSVYNAHNKEVAIEAIRHNATRLRQTLGGRIRKHVRRIPFLEFYLDDTVDEMYKVDELFNQIDKEREEKRKDSEEGENL